MNMVKINPGTAQSKFEQAVTDEIGVLTDTDAKDIAYYQEQNACALWRIGNEWHDIRLGASFENILKRYNHPLLTRWFDTNAYPIKEKSTGIQAPIDVYGVRTVSACVTAIPQARTKAVMAHSRLCRANSNICISLSSNAPRVSSCWPRLL